MITLINLIVIILFIIFKISKTPIIKLSSLILQTILVGSYIGITQQNYMWALIILIVLLGGIFVIFLYISRLTTKSHPNLIPYSYNKWRKIINILLTTILLLISFIISQPYFIIERRSLNLIKIYSSFLPSTILIGIYLFFILLIVVIIIQNNKRPIRSK